MSYDTVENEEHFLKAFLPMRLMVCGRFIDSILLQLTNTLLPMLVIMPPFSLSPVFSITTYLMMEGSLKGDELKSYISPYPQA